MSSKAVRLSPPPALRSIAAAVLLPLLLSACGGGGDPVIAGVAAAQVGNDIGDSFGDAISCAIQNCKESSTISTDNVSPRFTITQANGTVRVDAWLGQSANLLTTLQLSSGDALSASDGDGPARAMQDADGNRTHYVATFADASAQPRITVNFQRGSNVYPSVVTMLPPFTLSPLGPITVLHSAGQFDFQIQPTANMPTPGASVDASCQRRNGTSFQAQIGVTPLGDVHVLGHYIVKTSTLDDSLNAASLNQQPPDNSPVSGCKLSLVWSISTQGTVSSSLNRHGSIQATRSVKQTINYDALN